MDPNRFTAILNLTAKTIAFKANASSDEKKLLDSAVITAKAAAFAVSKQINADLSTILMIISTELNTASLQVAAEKE